jgi:hypothetical protein
MATLTLSVAKAAEKAYLSLAAEMEEQFGAEQSKMFGMPCLKIQSKAFCGLFKNDMVFKLTGDEHKRAMKLKDSKLFDPSGRDRPMKEWVQVSPSHKKEWKALAVEALKYVT